MKLTSLLLDDRTSSAGVATTALGLATGSAFQLERVTGGVGGAWGAEGGAWGAGGGATALNWVVACHSRANWSISAVISRSALTLWLLFNCCCCSSSSCSSFSMIWRSWSARSCSLGTVRAARWSGRVLLACSKDFRSGGAGIAAISRASVYNYHNFGLIFTLHVRDNKCNGMNMDTWDRKWRSVASWFDIGYVRLRLN